MLQTRLESPGPGKDRTGTKDSNPVKFYLIIDRSSVMPSRDEWIYKT